MSIDMPRGGRPLVMAKRIPACLRFATAAMARSVRTLSWVTSVPSTSARNSRMGGAMVPPVWFRQLVWRLGPVRSGARSRVLEVGPVDFLTPAHEHRRHHLRWEQAVLDDPGGC